MPEAGLRVATAIVSNAGFRDPSHNAARLELAGTIAEAARALSPQLVVLPMGFLAAPSEAEVEPLARALVEVFRRAGLAVVAGVDAAEAGLGPKGLGAATEARVAAGTLPYFLVADDGAALRGPWRQRSTSAGNAARVPEATPLDARVLTIGARRVALSACGELFHARLREAIAAAAPDLVVDVAHSGMGRTFQLQLPKLARESGAWVMNTQHMAGNDPHVAKWRLDPGGGNQSLTVPQARLGTRRDDAKAYGLWAELVVFDIPARA